MNEVNVANMRSQIKELKDLLNRYDEIMLNLYRQLDEACSVNWQDANSLSFADCVQDEKKETSLFVDYLNSRKDVYGFICEKYSSFGKRIAFDLKNKDNVIRAIDECCNKASNIINQFYYIDTSFYYEERWSIIQQRDKMYYVRNKLTELKNSVTSAFSKIENIEKDVNKKIKELGTMKINDFGFFFTGLGTASITKYKKDEGLLLVEGLEKNMSMISSYYKDEKECLNKINNKCNACNSAYKTSHTSDLVKSTEELPNIAKSIVEKRENYNKTLGDVINLYGITSEKIKDYFEKVGDNNE